MNEWKDVTVIKIIEYYIWMKIVTTVTKMMEYYGWNASAEDEDA